MTDRGVVALKSTAGRQVDYFDNRFPGFGLRVSPLGRKSWFVMYRFRRRPRRLTFGPYPHLSLADAKARAAAVMREVMQGVDPAAVKAEERRAETFAELAAGFGVGLATAWRYVRVRCVHCGGTDKISSRQIAGTSYLRAECCESCQGYSKVFYAEKAKPLEPLADDLASLGLDMMVGEEGFARAPNPFVLGVMGQPEG